MLPFLNPKKLGAVIMQRRAANGSVKTEGEEGSPKPEYLAAAEALIEGVHSKDAEKVAKAFQMLEAAEERIEQE